VREGGELLAIKGASAHEELDRDGDALIATGFIGARVREVGYGVVDPVTTVITARKTAAQ
jgi:16S rRNA (guanine527-N7)-methyltransferase